MLVAANVSSVPQRSPFRYPGGKTWLIPQIRQWLAACGGADVELVEPFAGGGVVSLTAVMEDLVGRATLIERDEIIADVWRAILGKSGRTLARRIEAFQATSEAVQQVLSQPFSQQSLCERAFLTILMNRVNHNGIIAPGAGRLNRGENGAGISSRWYPQTLSQRILNIVAVKNRLDVKCGNGLTQLLKYRSKENVVYFIDPPYSKVGERLYRFGRINHAQLFLRASRLKGDFLMTYSDTPEVRALAVKYGFEIAEIQMQGGRNNPKVELLIGRDLKWLHGGGHRTSGISTHGVQGICNGRRVNGSYTRRHQSGLNEMKISALYSV